MTDIHQLSAERPHIFLSPGDEITRFNNLQTPITTFTSLLNAAQSVEIDTSATKKGEAASKPDYSLTQRRLRNRGSCRKTRLKRKLQQHELEGLARERQERHQYLTQLAHKLGVNGSSKDGVQVPDSGHQDELFRELAAKSLHYSLVDQEYSGWVNAGNDQATTRENSEDAAFPSMRRSKRLRCDSDKDVSTAFPSDPAAPQASLFEQWRLIVDGLQNVDLKLHRVQETDLGAGVFDRHCYWKFVAVSSAKVQQEGEIAAVAVSGVTRVRFRQRRVQDITINTVRREHNVPFDFDAGLSNTDSAHKSKSRSMER
ncbi:hypothetical protein JG688_00011435 [Phytophthora aleatoria]|uniref:BZIP domain-containing protein n=1 Tax=Phytophthora aleatoria TaxID=2496075 RepID=A0A8J5ID06_9STRA|nr:hypothetical protein JG688_00011435 [Phytophthora aleatoria]